jgi:hypothetical protein
MQGSATGVLPALQIMTGMPRPAGRLGGAAAPQTALLASRRPRVCARRRRLGEVARILIKPHTKLRYHRFKLCIRAAWTVTNASSSAYDGRESKIAGGTGKIPARRQDPAQARRAPTP